MDTWQFGILSNVVLINLKIVYKLDMLDVITSQFNSTITMFLENHAYIYVQPRK